MKEIRLRNENILLIYDEDITVYDLKDINETTAYTKTKKNLNKCWQEVEQIFNDKTNFRDITELFNKYEIRYHRYCGLD